MAKTVAYGWAGAIMQVKLPIGVFSHCVTDGRTGRWTDGRTNRLTDSVTFRVARRRLKKARPASDQFLRLVMMLLKFAGQITRPPTTFKLYTYNTIYNICIRAG